MKKIKIILILVITILISGCSYKELNDLAIASALGIDYQNNEYIISAQIMELKKQEKEDTSSALIYLGKGKTISEALRNISLKYPNYLYLGHLELIIIGKGDGEPVGSIQDADGKMHDVYVNTEEKDELKKLSDEEQNRFYAMKEGINEVLDHLTD